MAQAGSAGRRGITLSSPVSRDQVGRISAFELQEPIAQGQLSLLHPDNLQLIRRRLGLHGAYGVIESLMLPAQGCDLGPPIYRPAVFWHRNFHPS
jgi:hypothetical protein